MTTTLISTEALAQMRAVQESNLPETAYIQRLTVTNGADGQSEAWTTYATVNARLGEPKGDVEKQVAATIKVGKVNVITLKAWFEILATTTWRQRFFARGWLASNWLAMRCLRYTLAP